MRLFKIALWSMVGVLILAGCGASQDTPDAGEAAPEEGEAGQGEPIVIGLDPYNFSEPPVYIAKQILEDRGYEVEIQEGQVGILWAALAAGDIDVFGDIWDPNISGSYIEQYEGEYETAGTLYEDAPVGVAVPTYMENIESIEQLNEMKDVFGGKIYTIDPESGTDITTRKMVDEYGLDYEVVNSSEAAMIAEAQKAMSQEEPIAFIGWRPHSMFQLLDIKLLDDPRNVWGSDDVKVGVASDLKERAPEAYTLFSNMEISIDEIERWLVEMEEGASPEEMAEAWVEDNADTVEAWLSE